MRISEYKPENDTGAKLNEVANQKGDDAAIESEIVDIKRSETDKTREEEAFLEQAGRRRRENMYRGEICLQLIRSDDNDDSILIAEGKRQSKSLGSFMFDISVGGSSKLHSELLNDFQVR